MKVKKRNGTLERLSLDAITTRIEKLCVGLDNIIDPVKITIEIADNLKDEIETSEIDELTAQICHAKSSSHPHFNVLASRLVISDHQKNVTLLCGLKFSQVCNILYHNNDQLGIHSPLISKELYDVSQQLSNEIDNIIDDDRDFLFDYFGFKTLLKSYLLKVSGKPIETPQHLFMRVALGIWGPVKDQQGKLYEIDLEKVKETYNLLSKKLFVHATPTLFNAGTDNNQLFSCFLVNIDDNLKSIYKVISDCAHISKWSGGIGLHISSIRGNGSYIRGTGGKADGIVPMIKVFNETARYVNQGGRRPGSFALYLEPWHTDIEDFLKLKINHGDQNKKARDLFYGLWIPDLFMERVEKDEIWSLMCPSECPGLKEVYGDKFKKLYEKYESEGRMTKQIRARELLINIITSQIQSGTPYILYKDAANNKSNQKNIGTICSSNLCCEIIEYSDANKYACCVISSVVLPTYVELINNKLEFNHNKLFDVVRVITRNLNKIIDINYYPVPETANSNFSERPIGIGVQGLHDVFFKLKLPYDSNEALLIDKDIHETIYYAALTESCELSKLYGPYATYEGSPISKGKFQFDLWHEYNNTEIKHSGRWDWNLLKKNIKKHGVRNSLVTCSMPTASTSQIMGSTAEAMEPLTSNCYNRRTNAGEITILNKYMAYDLIENGLWNDNMKDYFLKYRGSLNSINDIPENYKNLYKTVWEIKQKVLIDHSIARGQYIDQSQSLNLYFEDTDLNTPMKLIEKIMSAHLYSWRKGLKTGCYYLRSKSAANSVSFTLNDDDNEDYDDTNNNVKHIENNEEEEDENCVSCSG